MQMLLWLTTEVAIHYVKSWSFHTMIYCLVYYFLQVWLWPLIIPIRIITNQYNTKWLTVSSVFCYSFPNVNSPENIHFSERHQRCSLPCYAVDGLRTETWYLILCKWSKLCQIYKFRFYELESNRKIIWCDLVLTLIDIIFIW